MLREFLHTFPPRMRIVVIVEMIVGVLIPIVLIVVLIMGRSSSVVPSPTPAPADLTYVSSLLQVSLKYPMGWQLDTSYATIPGLDRFIGADGFFEASATNSPVQNTMLIKGTERMVKKYPKPIKLGTTTYRYFLLTADAEHIKSIGDSVVFMQP